jgi:hypothetical protein
VNLLVLFEILFFLVSPTPHIKIENSNSTYKVQIHNKQLKKEHWLSEGQSLSEIKGVDNGLEFLSQLQYYSYIFAYGLKLDYILIGLAFT